LNNHAETPFLMVVKARTVEYREFAGNICSAIGRRFFNIRSRKNCRF